MSGLTRSPEIAHMRDSSEDTGIICSLPFRTSFDSSVHVFLHVNAQACMPAGKVHDAGASHEARPMRLLRHCGDLPEMPLYGSMGFGTVVTIL